ALLAESEGRFQALLDIMDEHGDALLAIGEKPPPDPRWDQGWFARLDAAAAYAIVRSRRPARIIEVGSGHSTRFMVRAIADGGLPTRLTAIDPAPKADLSGLPLEMIRRTVQTVDLSVFGELGSGDVLFVDSSHIAMPGSDVDLLFSQILPALPAGILVHVHDIFLPDDYPPGWYWRGYNEQQAVAALLAGGGFRPLFASHYVASRMAAAVDRSAAGRLTLPPGTPETGLWLEKTADPIGPLEVR
ncbi:MAG: class I SAM-dependent methyltransferase, partial [Inquilinus sp.]|nr:class I SAM-dependent methyltransferase [Inquilinus sp.]